MIAVHTKLLKYYLNVLQYTNKSFVSLERSLQGAFVKEITKIYQKIKNVFPDYPFATLYLNLDPTAYINSIQNDT